MLIIFIPASLCLVYFTAFFSRVFTGLIVVSINAEGVQYVIW